MHTVYLAYFVTANQVRWQAKERDVRLFALEIGRMNLISNGQDDLHDIVIII